MPAAASQISARTAKHAVETMSILAQSIRSFSNFTPRAALGLISLAAVALATGISSPADAAPRAYDGTWNVTFTTRAGNCSSTNSAPFNVAGTQVLSAGGGKVTGGIRPGGAVAVNI